MKIKLPSFKMDKFDFLVSLYIFCIVVSELMGGKTFVILNGPIKLNASVAIFLMPIIFSVNDIITEVFGAERTRSVIRSGLTIIVFLVLFATLATILPPSSRFALTESAYDVIFKQSIRISLASLTAFALADFLDVLIFVKIRKTLGKKALWFRNNLSNIVSQFCDTFIFMTLAFYAFDKSPANNFAFLFSLILPYWFLKCFMSVIETPFVYLGVRWLKKTS